MARSTRSKRRAALLKAGHLREFDLQPLPRKNKHGKTRKTQAERDLARFERDPRRAVAEARAKQAGMTYTEANGATVLAQEYSDDMGLTLLALHHPAKAKRLHDMWRRICAANRTYLVLYLGQTGTPKNAALAMLPEHFGASAESAPFDIRTEGERAQAAIKAWADWRIRIDGIPNTRARYTLLEAVEGLCGDLYRDGKPTRAGRNAAWGLEMLDEQHFPRYRAHNQPERPPK